MNRITQLQKTISQPLLIKKKENLQYLGGRSFEHVEGWLLVSKKEVVFFGTGLEKVEAFKKTDSLKNFGKYIKKNQQLLIEDGFTYAEGEFLKWKIPGVQLKPVSSPVDELRLIKDRGEIASIKKSMQIVEKVFTEVKNKLRSAGPRPAITETELAQFIQAKGIEFGAEAVSFPAIVASGANAAVPHHVPGSKKLVPNESIIIDFGFKYKGYCSDFTRTVFLKTVPQKLKTAYIQTELAYRESINYIDSCSVPIHRPAKPINGQTTHPETSAAKAHNKAVDILKEKKLEKYFIHSLGHGTGLEIHEKPNLYGQSKDVLRDGMVFSIEPGVYFPRIGGIRIEDLVYLEGGKIKKFINVSTELEENIISTKY